MLEVHIERDWVMQSWKVLIRRTEYNEFLTPDGWIHVAPDAAPDRDISFCNIPDEAANLLLGTLGRALGAVEHPQQLRADYVHLRERHDRLVDAVIDLAGRPRVVATGKVIEHR